MNAIIGWVRRARIVGALAGIVGLAACESLSIDFSSIVYAVELSIENSGSLAFDQVTLHTQDGPKSFSDLDSGERTAYFGVSRDYGQSAIYVLAEGDTLILQVIDFVGATTLEPGRYSYLVSVLGAAGERFLRVELRRDGALEPQTRRGRAR